ncbi:MAG TPA: beta-ribofuranosylaminobenzene 5'-phosphate synthase family protein [Vicinamibacterales bacterium]|nr:beta-ribofuranosylaminobenzene 5'-phosphate synthase family protein [Vicinamibacterales bacterium]
MRARDEEAVFVEASARLHFGVLDLRGARGRWFGGVGASASTPTLLVSASRAETLVVEGEDALRATEFARQFLAHHRIPSGASLRVHRSLPPHAGLGSGTQLALAVARALAELYGVESDARDLARAVGRARRSAIGTWTFAGGGLVVEGGRRPDRDECGPLIARLPFPPTWRCVVAVPEGAPGISGAEESEAFAQLPHPAEQDVERVAHLVLMALLPALADADLDTFGRALSEIQEITGRWFAPAQGGTFAPGASRDLVHRLTEWGASGVGQSSWGPSVYGIVDGEDAGRRLADRVRAHLGASGSAFEGPFRSDGARVWRAAVHAVGARG